MKSLLVWADLNCLELFIKTEDERVGGRFIDKELEFTFIKVLYLRSLKKGYEDLPIADVVDVAEHGIDIVDIFW